MLTGIYTHIQNWSALIKNNQLHFHRTQVLFVWTRIICAAVISLQSKLLCELWAVYSRKMAQKQWKVEITQSRCCTEHPAIFSFPSLSRSFLTECSKSCLIPLSAAKPACLCQPGPTSVMVLGVALKDDWLSSLLSLN